MKNSFRTCWMGCVIALGCARQAPPAPPVAQNIPVVENKVSVPSAGVKSPEGGSFAFPGDKGGKLLGDLLQPEDKSVNFFDSRPGPAPLGGKAVVGRPGVPAPAHRAETPHQAPQPQPVPEEAPLEQYWAEAPMPETLPMAADGLLHWPSADINDPAPLPLLAQAQADRAPLTDPTTSASAAAALAATMPLRVTPAQFLCLILPDPFKHQQEVRLRNPVEEDPIPMSDGSWPLGK